MNPVVVDISHYQNPTSFANAKKAGLWGVIHKATEGHSIVDDKYAKNRAAATKAGLLWGAYHFFRPGRIEDQVTFFLNNAMPQPGTLLCLDHEDEGCSVADVETFLRLLDEYSPQLHVLYSGDLIKEQLGNQVHPYLQKNTRLWLAEYGPKSKVQATWDKYWLWQFTGDGDGPQPHSWAGIGDKIDISHFDGTYDELVDEWAMQRTGDTGIGSDIPPTVSPALTKGDIVRWGQASLNFLGSDLLIDGNLGPKTDTALKQFQFIASIPETGKFDQATVAMLVHKITDWSADRR